MTEFQLKLHAIIQSARAQGWTDLADYTQKALDDDIRTGGGVERQRPPIARERRMLSWQEYANIKSGIWMSK